MSVYYRAFHTIIQKVKERKVKLLSRVRLFVTPWTVAHQAPPYKEFSRQEYWSGLPFPSPGDLPYPRIEPRSSALQADALPSEAPGSPTIIQKLLLIILGKQGVNQGARRVNWALKLYYICAKHLSSAIFMYIRYRVFHLHAQI